MAIARPSQKAAAPAVRLKSTYTSAVGAALCELTLRPSNSTGKIGRPRSRTAVSTAKVENVVKLPQKPVAAPTTNRRFGPVDLTSSTVKRPRRRQPSALTISVSTGMPVAVAMVWLDRTGSKLDTFAPTVTEVFGVYVNQPPSKSVGSPERLIAHRSPAPNTPPIPIATNVRRSYPVRNIRNRRVGAQVQVR